MIEVRNLSKAYDGVEVVKNINFEINTGEFYALLGPNGAGKTTTISMLSTLLLPNSGEILIDGETLTRKRKDIKRKVAMITQEYSMRQDMNMDEVMEYQGRLYFVPGKEIKRRTDELFEFTGLTKHRWKDVRHLSGGMKRKLMVCRALLTEPEILLLDEPTAGMDALARRQMWNLLRQLNDKGLTILLTTHYIEEAEKLCDRVALMNGGEIQKVAAPGTLIEELGAYAVDRIEPEGIQSRYFKTKQQAVDCFEKTKGQCSLRDTTLEDVFVASVGRSLEGKDGKQ